MLRGTRDRALCLLIAAIALFPIVSRAQYVDCTKGLLIMPSGEMDESGTFSISNNFLNKHYTTDKGGFGWTYHTFSYGFDVTFWSRLEVGYVCTIFNGAWRPEEPSKLNDRQRIVRNQDRHFLARLQVLKENEFGFKWMPSLVFGVSDPVTGSGGGEYIGSNVSETSNGFFNRYYAALSKNFDTPWGAVGAHFALQYTARKDFLATGPCVGVTWNPTWLNSPDSFLSSFRVIAEYDSKNFNIGCVTTVWNDHFAGWICLEGVRWINAGIKYRVVIR